MASTPLASKQLPAPTVQWSQNMTCARLTIKLLNIPKKSVEMSLDEQGMFKCELNGTGNLGQNTRYAFAIPLDNEIFCKQPVAKLHPAYLEIKLKKTNPVYLTRLTPSKLAFLKLDFDRYQSESDAEAEHEDNQIKVTVENRQRKTSNMKKAYLLSFNFFQACTYGYILVNCILGVLNSTKKDEILTLAPHFNAWKELGKYMIIAQVVAFLETVNGIVGLSKTNWMTSLFQNIGRGMVVAVIHYNSAESEGADDIGVITYLMIVWCSIEVIRYPLYCLTLMKVKFELLIWLRYTAFIPLYPLGIVLEYATLFFTVWEKSLGNESILPGILLRVYMLIGLLGFWKNYMYMFKQRKSKFGGGKKLKSQ